MTEWTWTVPATVVRVVDGDTIIVTLDLGWRVYRNDERIRVMGIAAPEIRGPEREAGLAAKAHAESLLPVGSSVLVVSQAKPTFERTAWGDPDSSQGRLRRAHDSGRPRGRVRSVIVYGVVSKETEKVVEFFHDREAAERFVGEVPTTSPRLLQPSASSWSSSRRRRRTRRKGARGTLVGAVYGC